jgi:hypothetical protein
MGFERAARMLANFLSAREMLPDVCEHISLIAKGHVGQLLREWNQALGGFGILPKKLFADLAGSHVTYRSVTSDANDGGRGQLNSARPVQVTPTVSIYSGLTSGVNTDGSLT